MRLHGLVGGLLRRGKFCDRCGAEHRRRKNDDAAEFGRQRGAERVEGLGEIQPARRGALRSKQTHVRVGRDLQQRDAACEYEKAGEEHAVGRHCGGRIEQERAKAGNDKADDDAVLVADRGDDASRRQRHDEIGAEEGELHQHDLRVVKRKQRLQVRDENVVEDGEKAPHEEDGSGHSHRDAVRRRLSLHAISLGNTETPERIFSAVY